MSKLDELIQQYCPDGVKFRTLDGNNGVAHIVGGKDYKHLGKGNVPIYGSGGIMGYCDKSAYNKPTVLIPRKGSIANIYYVITPFWNVDTIFYTEIDETIISPKFLYFWLCNYHVEDLNTSNAARPALTREVLKDIPVPVPPLPVQEEIVRILDTYTELEAKLEEELGTELELRKKQYEYYRDKLFDKDENLMTIREVIESLHTGLNPRKNFVLNSKGATCNYVTGKEIRNNRINITNRTDKITNDVVDLINNRAQLCDNILLFASTGCSTVGRMAIVENYDGTWNVSETMYCIKPKDIISVSYLMHALYSYKAVSQYADKISKGTVPHLKVSDLLDVKIPVPNKTEQERIVKKLDNYTTLNDNLNIDLSMEQTMRHQQYEYYRDKLLMFKKKESA